VDDERYSRQTRFAPIGDAGQQRIRAARVAVVGCGALGSIVAEQLSRAGVGRLSLIDRDFVEASNLQRQSLYREEDARRAAPKAVALAERLAEINAEVAYDAVVADVAAGNVVELLRGHDLVVDGGDNFPLRHLVNEACCLLGVPWVHGACVGAYGVCVAIVPGDTACLRCLQDMMPAAGDSPTCDTAGVIAPIAHVVAGLQVAEALKLLVGDGASVRRALWAIDVWTNDVRRLDLTTARDPRCLACGAKATRPLLAAGDEAAIALCGRDAIQIRRGVGADLDRLRERLGPSLTAANAWLVRWRDGALSGTCFRDGRVVVHGTADPARARAFADRWLG